MSCQLSTSATLARVLLPFSLGYFLSYLFRTVNAVIGPEVASALSLGAAEIGLVTSAYFLTFAASQIPLGVALDRYGPRRVEATLLLVAALGAVIFALGQSSAMLALGRGLIGLGVSSCLMAAMKANAQWWAPERWALANGTTLAVGGLGALVATAPVEAALTLTDWRGVFVVLAAATVFVAALIFLVVPDKSPNLPGEDWRLAFRGAAGVFTDPVFLRIAPLAMLNQATLLAYHSLWTGAWLRDVGGLDRTETGTALAIATSGLMLGMFGMGLAADRLMRVGVTPAAVAGAGSAVFLLIQLGLVLRVPVPDTALWAAFVFFGTSSTLFFTVLAQAFPRHLTGRVNTALNMLVFSAAFLLQWLVGVLLAAWPQLDGKAPVAAHVAAMSGILALEGLAFAWFLARRPGPALTVEP